MSKTIETQIEKCRLLVDKLKNKSADAEARGITAGALTELERKIGELAEAGKMCDEMRRQTAEQVKCTNTLLTEVKDVYADMKKKIKGYYPQERWMEYGVPDKR